MKTRRLSQALVCWTTISLLAPGVSSAAPVVSGDRAGVGGTTHALAFDGQIGTYFRSSYNDWQFIQVDYGITGTFTGLRRYMTSNGTNVAGARTLQGEGAMYSLDGLNWKSLTSSNTVGWTGYVNYGAQGQAWHTVPYGWSAWLNLTSPVPARFVRFQWDGNNDALNEVGISFAPFAVTPPTNTLTAVADAQTLSGVPGMNYGSLGAFSVTEGAGAEAARSYLRFDLTAIPRAATIQSAQLQVFAADIGGTGTRQVQVFNVSTPWVENSLRWSNQPATTSPGPITTIAINQWNTWDVTPLARAWLTGVNNGVALRPVLIPGQSFSVTFRSREATTNRPRLVVSYALPTPPPTAAYLALRQESVTTPVGYFQSGLPTTVQMRWPIPSNAPADPLPRTLDFLERFRELYRLGNPREQLVPRRRTTSADGRHVVFEQIHEGIPVYGSRLAVHLTKTHVVGTSGRWLDKLPVLPPATVTVAQAETGAKAWVEEHGGNRPSILGVSRLAWLNPSLAGGGTNQTWLAWRVSLSARPDGQGTAWSAFIDAHSAARRHLVQRMQTHDAPDKDFTVYTANGNTNFNCDVTDTSTEWFDTDGPTGYPGFAADSLREGTNGWRFLHATYDYYYNNFNRLSLDDCDMEIEVYAHAGFNNAFFEPNCDILAFGNGQLVNDVFAHEYTHGVTHFTADLQYQDQPGALNESVSDVFGAMIDTGDWLFGEDRPGGESRSLASPTDFFQPDHMTNSFFFPMPPTNVRNQANDWGGVHINSGIPNKVAYLLGNGGSHSGFSVRQIGRSKVQRLWYDVLTTRLGPSSQFIDLRNEAVTLTREYWRQGLYGFASIDICDVINAFASVGLGPGDLDCDGVDDVNDEDTDGDGIPNSVDNCDTTMNWGQFDLDGDGLGDDCDPDDDNDGVPDLTDNAPYTFNPDQADSDHDGRGDVIDDSDGDGLLDINDNCPNSPNRDQLNTDGDSMGDACDSDDDNDGVPDTTDNAPKVPNPNQLDTDHDGFGDVIDKCPTVFTPPFQNFDRDGDGLGDICDNDIDGDGLTNAVDNCPTSFNPDQLDMDHNGIGYACDVNERLAYPPFDLRRITAEIKFLNNARMLKIPLDFCTVPGCGDPLPEDFVTLMNLGLPAGIKARIVDDEGFVVAKSARGGAQTLRFPARGDWAYNPPPGGPGSDSFAAAAATEPYRGISYTLELERQPSVPADRPINITIELGTEVSSAARLAIRIENRRPVVTIQGRPHRDYRLESSTNLSTWTPQLTTNSPTGNIVFTGQQPVTGRLFYRGVLLP